MSEEDSYDSSTIENSEEEEEEDSGDTNSEDEEDWANIYNLKNTTTVELETFLNWNLNKDTKIDPFYFIFDSKKMEHYPKAMGSIFYNNIKRLTKIFYKIPKKDNHGHDYCYRNQCRMVDNIVEGTNLHYYHDDLEPKDYYYDRSIIYLHHKINEQHCTNDSIIIKDDEFSIADIMKYPLGQFSVPIVNIKISIDGGDFTYAYIGQYIIEKLIHKKVAGIYWLAVNDKKIAIIYIKDDVMTVYNHGLFTNIEHAKTKISVNIDKFINVSNAEHILYKLLLDVDPTGINDKIITQRIFKYLLTNSVEKALLDPPGETKFDDIVNPDILQCISSGISRLYKSDLLKCTI